MPDHDPPTNDVLVIVPSRSRPDSSLAFADAFFAHSTRSDLLFALDDDDPVAYPRLDGVRYETNPRLRLAGTLNLVATKYLDQYRFLAFLGDDHRIRTAGWDRLLVEVIEDLPAGIAYGNDLLQGPNLPTAVLMKADIVRALGFMALPSLVHTYIDNFWRDLGNALGSLRYRDDVVIEHLHFTVGKAEEDTPYREANLPDAIARDATAYQSYTHSRLALDVAKVKFLMSEKRHEEVSAGGEEHSAADFQDGTPESSTLPRIWNGRYGTESCFADVTRQLQELVREGHLRFTVSNSLFGDPCPYQLKTLRFTYSLPGDDRQYSYGIDEHQDVMLPSHQTTQMPGLLNVLQEESASLEQRPSPVSLPLVSCICPTFNRPPKFQHLLEESIESFLRQDYPNKELIVINDCPGQELLCDAEGVTVINVPRRFRTLGEKRNAAIGMSQGELIALWDDDDISLPWRLSFSVERLGEAGYFPPRNYWMWYGGRLLHDHVLGHSHNCSIYTRSAYEACGGYPFVSLGDDTALDRALSKSVRTVDPHIVGKLKMEEWFYLYRFGVSNVHGSAGGDEGVGLYRHAGEMPVVQGSFNLHPHWQRDYVALIQWGLEHPEEACERCV